MAKCLLVVLDPTLQPEIESSHCGEDPEQIKKRQWRGANGTMSNDAVQMDLALVGGGSQYESGT